MTLENALGDDAGTNIGRLRERARSMHIGSTATQPHVRVAILTQAPQVNLWRCSLTEMPGASQMAWLGADERVRAARFAFERDRRRYLAARCALRECLSERTGMAPGDLQIESGVFEKPLLANARGWFFNLSRREDWALIGISRAGEIGVDFELLHAVEKVDALALAHFSVAEFDTFQGLPTDSKDRVFLRVWTRKEACLKAVGTGLRIEPRTLEVGLGEGIVRLAISLPTGAASVEVRSVDSGPDSVAAIARLL